MFSFIPGFSRVIRGRPRSSETVETVPLLQRVLHTWLKPGVNERMAHSVLFFGIGDLPADYRVPNIPRFIKRNQIRTLAFFNRTTIVIDAEQARWV